MGTTSTARIANDSLFCEAHVAMDKIIEQLIAMADAGGTADAATQLLAKDGTALLRELLQGYFDRRAEQERRVRVVGVDGIERSEVRTASRRIETPVGEIEVKRLLYQAPGVEGLAPLDAALGLPDEKYTHDVRRIVAEESAKSSFDEVVERIAKRTGAHVPKRQVEELTVRAAQDFDAYYRDRLCEPEQTDDLLVLSFDGKGIAMRHEDLREATRKAAAAEPKLHTRLAKGEKPNRKRMAHVAAVYSIAPWPRTSSDVLHGLREPRAATRPRPTNKRVWASAARDAGHGASPARLRGPNLVLGEGREREGFSRSGRSREDRERVADDRDILGGSSHPPRSWTRWRRRDLGWARQRLVPSRARPRWRRDATNSDPGERDRGGPQRSHDQAAGNAAVTTRSTSSSRNGSSPRISTASNPSAAPRRSSRTPLIDHPNVNGENPASCLGQS